MKLGLSKRLLVAAAATLIAYLPASSSVIINIIESGGGISVDYSGSLDISGATADSTYGGHSPGMIAGGTNWWIGGPTGSVTEYNFSSYDGPFGTSTSFITPPTTQSGDPFWIWGDNNGTPSVGLVSNYISGDAISGSLTFAGTSFASFGMTAGTSFNYYIPNDVVVVNIGGAAPAPAPAALGFLGLGLAGLGLARRRRSA